MRGCGNSRNDYFQGVFLIKVLGIDPGTQRMGWGLIEIDEGKTSLIDSGVYRPKKIDRIERLVEIHNYTLALLKKFNPSVVAIEDTFFGKNPQSMIKLGEARSSAMLAAAVSGIDVANFAPREIKMALVGNGNAAKEQVAFMVQTLIGAPQGKPLNETDAIAVAFCWAQRAIRAR